MTARAVETTAVAAFGTLFGSVFGRFVGDLVDLQTELTVAGGVIGGLNGAIGGWRRTYDWSCSHGPIAFTLDSTWALPMTAAGLVANGYGLATWKRSGYLADLSERQNRHVYRKGLVFRKGFAATIGNVIDGARDVERPRRRRLINDHENVHVWQGRWFGIFYPVLFGGWFLFGSGAGVVVWLARGRKDPLGKTVETVGYYMNPYEWWAYSRDDHWRPQGMVDGVGWTRPWVMPLATARALRAGGEPDAQ